MNQVFQPVGQKPATPKALTLGQLLAFVKEHNLSEDAEIIVDHEQDQRMTSYDGERTTDPVVSAGVSIFMNGHAELVLHLEA